MTLKKPLLIILFTLFLSCFTNYDLINTKSGLNSADPFSANNSASNETIDYLIITTESFTSILEPLAMWKTQKGIVSKIETINNIQLQYSGVDLPEKIKNCIIDYYDHNNTQWVLLAGDHNHIPSKYIVVDDDYEDDGDVVSCDSYYGDIDNDWNLDEFDFNAEVYIGRLTANNEAEMSKLVQRILDYEKEPPIGPWMTQALYAGAILQFDQDWGDNETLDYGECDTNRLNHYIDSNLIPDNWSKIFLGQTIGIKGSDYYVDDEIAYFFLKNYITQGCSISTIFAHGRRNRISIGTWTVDHDGDGLFDYTANPFSGGGIPIDEMYWNDLFETSDTDLKAEDKLGLYFFGSCSVGTFDAVSDCVAEYFLKNVGIGCVAGSHTTWSEDQWYEREHGGWFVDGLAFRFLEQLFEYNQPGKALALAKADYAADRIAYPEPIIYTEWSNKTLKQYNLLGDPEVPVWLSIPHQLNVSIVGPFNDITNTTTLKVTADQDPVQGVTITYTQENNLLWKGETNENGTIDVPFSDIDVGNNVFTASKNGYLPFQANLPEEYKNLSSISGFDTFGIFIILLSFIGIASIHYKRFHFDKNN
ncbi:MAG: C25 family cysteine peptidase [Candidatus Thorarchaeota archaeon]